MAELLVCVVQGEADLTKCFYCGGGLSSWVLGDDPWEEHARQFPECRFVMAERGDNFSWDVRLRHAENDRQNSVRFEQDYLLSISSYLRSILKQ